jgi:hypothetical protein
MAPRRRVAAIGAIGGAVALAGCEALVGIHDRSIASDASVSAAADGGADAHACEHAVPPARPAFDDGTMDLDLTFALNALDLGVRLDAGVSPLVGYDVDGVCTCPDGPSCAPFDPEAMHCDAPGGRDQAINLVFQTFAELTGGMFDPTTYSTEVLEGANGVLVRLQHYDGAANDTQVAVSVYLSPGTVSMDGGAGHPLPRWDGNDTWGLDSESVLTSTGGVGALPVHFDVNGYVTANVLVAHADFPIELYAGPQSGTAVLDGVGMVLTATVIPVDGGGYRLMNGTIAGRVPIARLPRCMAGVVAGDASFICPGSSEYAALKTDVCRLADVLATPGAVDAGAPCDALGFGVAFGASQALLGPIADRPASGSPCTDAGPDTCN